jgi:hypothetical protein
MKIYTFSATSIEVADHMLIQKPWIKVWEEWKTILRGEQVYAATIATKEDGGSIPVLVKLG